MNLEKKMPVGQCKLQVLRLFATITGAAACLSLASCVSPYGGYGGASATYTTYSPGYRINALPRGYRRESISGSTYYYQNGNYYRPSSGGYVVIAAPRSSRYYAEYDRIHQSGQQSHGKDRKDQHSEQGNNNSKIQDRHR